MVFLFTSAACQHKFPNVYEIFNPFKPDNQIYSIITLCVNWVNGLFQTGYYMPRADVLRKQYRVTLPALTDISFLGRYIEKECLYFQTYTMEKMVGDHCMYKYCSYYIHCKPTLFCDLLVNYFHSKANSYEYRLKQIQKTPRYQVHSSNICTEEAFMNLAKLSCIHIKLVYSNSPILMIHLHLQSTESILG